MIDAWRPGKECDPGKNPFLRDLVSKYHFPIPDLWNPVVLQNRDDGSQAGVTYHLEGRSSLLILGPQCGTGMRKWGPYSLRAITVLGPVMQSTVDFGDSVFAFTHQNDLSEERCPSEDLESRHSIGSHFRSVRQCDVQPAIWYSGKNILSDLPIAIVSVRG